MGRQRCTGLFALPDRQKESASRGSRMYSEVSHGQDCVLSGTPGTCRSSARSHPKCTKFGEEEIGTVKQKMQEHCRACGQVFSFLTTHAILSGESHLLLTTVDQHLVLMDGCAAEEATEMERLFREGWLEGEQQARLAWETGDLAIYASVGRAAGFTTRRPPRHYRGYTPARDVQDGNIHGMALRSFVLGWRQTCAAERSRQGV